MFAPRLFADEQNEAEEEEGGEEVEHPVLAAGTAGEELDESVAGEAEAETVGDGEVRGMVATVRKAGMAN